MLDQLRQGAQGWVSKVLMGLLVLSFAVWGIGGFQGYGAGTLATVGDSEVTIDEFGRTYSQMQRNAQQSGQQADPEQVLSSLLHAAALEDEAKGHNLGVSQERIAREIASNPAFQGISGTFDSNRFAMMLDDAGINRDDFVDETRRSLVRDQLAESLGAGLTAPKPLIEAVYRVQNEERTVSFVVIDESTIEPVGEPGASTLQTYFDENRADFAAPEYRKLGLLVLDPKEIAKPETLSAEDVAAEYQRTIKTFTKEERRHVQQIRFDTAEEANAALAEIEGGKDFVAFATEKGFSATDIDLGMNARSELIDPAIAEAAFATEPNKAVAVTEGAFQPTIIRVTEVEAGSVTPLSEVESTVREDMATRAATEEVRELYDQVEDERAGGATLEEVATKLSLPYRVIDAIAADGTGPNGEIDGSLPNQPQVISEAFESDVGVENSPVQGNDEGWVFYEVLGIDAAHDRPLDEVRDRVIETWTATEIANRIAAKADASLARLKQGVPMATVAAEIKKPVQTVENVTRGGEAPAGLTANAVSQAFAGPEGHAASAEGEGSNRILLKVDTVTAPAFFAEAQGVPQMTQALNQAVQNDLLSTYNRQLLQVRTTSVNNAAFQQLTGQIQETQ